MTKSACLPSISRGLARSFFHSGENGARVITEVDDELDEFFGFGDIFDAFNGADTDVERFEGDEGNDWFDGRGRKVRHRLAPEICRVGGDRERGVAAFVADGSVGDETEGNDAGPDFQRVVIGVVFNVTSADFCRDFGEGQFENACGF